MKRPFSIKANALLRRLHHTEALLAGATTDGERVAARKARERLLTRIRSERANDPIVRLVVAEFASRAHVDVVAAPDAVVSGRRLVPTAQRIAEVLRAWLRGDRTRREVLLWAARVVDQVVLPCHPPEDVRSIPVEVLLQLSAMHHQPMGTEDLPALLAFLEAPPDEALEAWHRWFAYVESVDWRARRVA